MTEVVLVVGAHPDDEILGCGGTIARHVRAGDAVHVAIMGEGIMSRYAPGDGAPHDDERSRLGACARRAGDILGITSINFHSFPDNRMDGLDQLDVNRAVEGIVAGIRPTIVYTHHPFDLNVDHRCIHEGVLTACRPLPGASVRRILCFETPSSTEWQTALPQTAFVPNYYVDISDTLDAKIAALGEYASEMRPFPHPRSLEGVTHLARWRGACVSCAAAEAFTVARILI